MRLSAIRKLASEAGDNALIDPELAAGIGRVKGAKVLGIRTGNWLSRDQAERLIKAPNPLGRTGKRDRAIFGLLIGCGLRRTELVSLTPGHIQQREGRWITVDIQGKGGRIRSVPMPAWSKALIDDYDVIRKRSLAAKVEPVRIGALKWHYREQLGSDWDARDSCAAGD